jgi:hypothetical protein
MYIYIYIYIYIYLCLKVNSFHVERRSRPGVGQSRSDRLCAGLEKLYIFLLSLQFTGQDFIPSLKKKLFIPEKNCRVEKMREKPTEKAHLCCIYDAASGDFLLLVEGALGGGGGYRTDNPFIKTPNCYFQP